VITPADGLSRITWIGLIAGALVLLALWRALRRTDSPGTVLEPYGTAGSHKCQYKGEGNHARDGGEQHSGDHKGWDEIVLNGDDRGQHRRRHGRL
jgi:hypothetical protein